VRLHFEEGERELLVARLGLADDADDAAIAQAMATWVTEERESGSGGGNGNAQGSHEAGDLEANADDAVVIDVAEFNRLRRRDRVAAEVEETTRRRDRDELIEEAIHDGKFSPSRRDHYKHRYDSDPEGTVTLIGRLVPNTVPLEARGVDVPTDEVDDTAYPSDWVPEVNARVTRETAQGTRPNRVHGEG
jgi:Mu-like prophage I protein